jgi:hypothetical protein
MDRFHEIHCNRKAATMEKTWNINAIIARTSNNGRRHGVNVGERSLVGTTIAR